MGKVFKYLSLVKIMSRKQYSKSELRELMSKFSFLEKFIDKKSNVAREDEFLLIENKPLFFFKEEVLVPTLSVLLKGVNVLPMVVVDKGAIRFVVNGADVMRPGIIGCDEFSKGDYIVIVDETYKKPLAVGQALLCSNDLLQAKEGKVIKNIHFVGDIIWEKCK
jgi:PUA-domain protein